MRTMNFAKRCSKEILRDPLSFIFSLLLPLFLLFIFQQFNIPNAAYMLENFTPGTVIFSFSFLTLFVASLVAKDRKSALLIRLAISPMKPIEYILGYALSVLPLVILQNLLFWGFAAILGLKITFATLITILASIPISLLYIFIGIMIGSLTSERASSGISSIIVQLVAFTSGMYFDASIVGNAFGKVCKALPFSNGLNIIKGILNSNFDGFYYAVLNISVYTVVIIFISVFVFKKNMTSDKR